MVALLNANLFDIYREISANESKRNLIVQSGERIASRLREQPAANSEQINQTLDRLVEAIIRGDRKERVALHGAGLQRPAVDSGRMEEPQWPTAQKTIETVAGWLITTMLLSVGAPFWQDTLESLFGLKNMLRRQNPPGAVPQPPRQ